MTILRQTYYGESHIATVPRCTCFGVKLGPYVISAAYDTVQVLKQLSKELKLLLSILCQESKTKHLKHYSFSRAKLILFNK